VCYVHDEKNEARNGDTVEIMETRRLSRSKNWRLVRIVKQAPRTGGADLALPGSQSEVRS
jgi:hypothetical protein